ncbi:MAG: hypothetical protein OEY91_04155, partial [Nitrospirota bacterium]|nr:hypothetical protein [Nitrospirota bacterium]
TQFFDVLGAAHPSLWSLKTSDILSLSASRTSTTLFPLARQEPQGGFDRRLVSSTLQTISTVFWPGVKHTTERRQDPNGLTRFQ